MTKMKRPNVAVKSHVYNLIKELGYKWGELLEDNCYYIFYDPELSETFRLMLCNKDKIKYLDEQIEETSDRLNRLTEERNALLEKQEAINKALDEFNYETTKNMEHAISEAWEEIRKRETKRMRPMTIEDMKKIARSNHVPLRAMIERLTELNDVEYIKAHTIGCEKYFNNGA